MKEKKLKIFRFESHTYIVAESIRKALDIFNKAYGYDPDDIFDMSDNNFVFVQDVYEPIINK